MGWFSNVGYWFYKQFGTWVNLLVFGLNDIVRQIWSFWLIANFDMLTYLAINILIVIWIFLRGFLFAVLWIHKWVKWRCVNFAYGFLFWTFNVDVVCFDYLDNFLSFNFQTTIIIIDRLCYYLLLSWKWSCFVMGALRFS